MSVFLLFARSAHAHPGIGIVADSRGNIYYTDLKQVWPRGRERGHFPIRREAKQGSPVDAVLISRAVADEAEIGAEAVAPLLRPIAGAHFNTRVGATA